MSRGDGICWPLPGAVVVTGGGGIGRAAALGCAALGAPVAILDLDEDVSRAVAAEAMAAGATDAVGIACDVRDDHAVEAAVRIAADRLGPLRGLVTAAGIDIGGLAHEQPLAEWDKVIAVNLTGTFLACRHVLRNMLDHQLGGSIVCVSSAWAQVSAPGGATAYCASKGAVSALVRSVALDYASRGVRVNGIIPGATETPLMWANVPADQVAAMRQRIGGQIAMGRLAQPEDITGGILWLLSDASAYATGSHLVVDGGLMAKGSVEG